MFLSSSFDSTFIVSRDVKYDDVLVYVGKMSWERKYGIESQVLIVSILDGKYYHE